MRRFKNLLVGVDLSCGDRFVGEEPSLPNAEAIRRALWLAELNQARVTFFCALDISPKAQSLLKETHGIESHVIDDAKQALAKIVNYARDQGVVAESKIVFGKSWLELIRQVLRNQHDMVVVGTRHQGTLERHFLGGTGVKLLRKCPCPVWVTMPLLGQAFESVVVAHDLRPVGDLAMDLGSDIASLNEATLHVVHAVEYAELDYLLPVVVVTEKVDDYRDAATQYIAQQIAELQMSQSSNIEISTDPPEVAILKAIERHKADLLVIGTIGRSGISGMFTGATAERLLPQISCSVLAVKPPGFVSPVTL